VPYLSGSTALISLLRRLAPDKSVSRRDILIGQAWLLRNGVASQIMDTLTIGTFLVAYALELGASNLVIGLLAAVPHVTQFAQLLGVYLIERFRARRQTCVVAAAIARPMLLIMAGAAFVDTQSWARWSQRAGTLGSATWCPRRAGAVSSPGAWRS